MSTDPLFDAQEATEAELLAVLQQRQDLRDQMADEKAQIRMNAMAGLRAQKMIEAKRLMKRWLAIDKAMTPL